MGGTNKDKPASTMISGPSVPLIFTPTKVPAILSPTQTNINPQNKQHPVVHIDNLESRIERMQVKSIVESPKTATIAGMERFKVTTQKLAGDANLRTSNFTFRGFKDQEISPHLNWYSDLDFIPVGEVIPPNAREFSFQDTTKFVTRDYYQAMIFECRTALESALPKLSKPCIHSEVSPLITDDAVSRIDLRKLKWTTNINFFTKFSDISAADKALYFQQHEEHNAIGGDLLFREENPLGVLINNFDFASFF